MQKVNVTVGINASLASGYVSVGFPSTPGAMVGATAMILQTCVAGSSGCTDGAIMRQWYMSSEEQSGVNLDNRMALSNIQAAYLTSSDQLVGSFQMVVNAPASTTAAGRRRRLQQLEGSDGTMPLIFAAGDVAADGTPIKHYAYSSGVLPLASGSGDGELLPSRAPTCTTRTHLFSMINRR